MEPDVIRLIILTIVLVIQILMVLTSWFSSRTVKEIDFVWIAITLLTIGVIVK